MTARTYRFGMTADEWLHLASRGERSEVGPCCAQISQLREALQMITTEQDDELLDDSSAFATSLFDGEVVDAYQAVLDSGDDHRLTHAEDFPLLHRVLDGIRVAAARRDEHIARYRRERGWTVDA